MSEKTAKDAIRVVGYRLDVKLKLGSTNAAILLHQISFWGGTKYTEDGWFYKTHDEWLNEIGLTRRELETARDILIKKNLIEYSKRISGNKGYYKLNKEVFNEMFGSEHEDEPKKRRSRRKAEPKEEEDTTEKNKDIAELIHHFALEVNPHCAEMYKHKTQREACERMLKIYGKEFLLITIKSLKDWNKMPYVGKAEKAFTPKELEKNIARIAARADAERVKKDMAEEEKKSKVTPFL